MAGKGPVSSDSSPASHSGPSASLPSPALPGDEDPSKKLWAKAREAPYVPAGEQPFSFNLFQLG